MTDVPSVAAEHRRDALVQLDDDGDGGLRVTLKAEPASVSVARQLVAAQWAQLDDEALGDVEVIVTELVSNAVKHGRPEIELHLRAEPFAINVAVLDHHPAMPPAGVSLPDQQARSGRGLFMVDQLSQRWGVDPLPDDDGKIVWASIATDRAAR